MIDSFDQYRCSKCHTFLKRTEVDLSSDSGWACHNHKCSEYGVVYHQQKKERNKIAVTIKGMDADVYWSFKRFASNMEVNIGDLASEALVNFMRQSNWKER